MLPFSKILCPTDFSAPSLVALAAAVELVQQYDAKLLLVHVADPVPTLPESIMVSPQDSRVSFDVDRYQNMLHGEASSRLDRICEEHVPRDVDLQRIITPGQPADRIVELARDVDLIVIATNGRTGVSRLFTGSVAEKVVRTACCPVLTIRTCEG